MDFRGIFLKESFESSLLEDFMWIYVEDEEILIAWDSKKKFFFACVNSNIVRVRSSRELNSLKIFMTVLTSK